MFDKILNNKYRYLNLYSNASEKELQRALDHIESHNTFLLDSLSKVNLTESLIEETRSFFTKDTDTLYDRKLNEALFYFNKQNKDDEIALSFLLQNDLDNALVTLQKSKGSYLNLALVYLLKDNIAKALEAFDNFFNKNHFKKYFLPQVVSKKYKAHDNSFYLTYIHMSIVSFYSKDKVLEDLKEHKMDNFVLYDKENLEIESYFIKVKDLENKVNALNTKKLDKAFFDKVTLYLDDLSANLKELSHLNLNTNKAGELDNKVSSIMSKILDVIYLGEMFPVKDALLRKKEIVSKIIALKDFIEIEEDSLVFLTQVLSNIESTIDNYDFYQEVLVHTSKILDEDNISIKLLNDIKAFFNQYKDKFKELYTETNDMHKFHFESFMSNILSVITHLLRANTKLSSDDTLYKDTISLYNDFKTYIDSFTVKVDDKTYLDFTKRIDKILK